MPSPHLAHAGALASAILLFALLAAPASSQTLHDFVEAAAARNPDLAALTGRRDAIGARQSAADALTPGAPTFSGSYATDQVLRNRQQREAQIGISTPIWLPGEGTASRHVADAELSRSSAQAAAIKLKVAGQVRDSLAEFALAQAELAVAERRLRDARTLEGDVSRRARAGEASEADVLLARAERIATDGELRDRRVALEQSRLDFQSLTGIPPVAAAMNEPIPAPAATAHPRLEDAKGAIDVARANQALAGIQVRDSPEIGVVARRNRDIYGTVYDNSIGIELRIPFATDARNRPRQTAAQAELTEASAGYAAAEREIGTEQQKARIGYDNALVQRDLARERMRALAQQSALVGRGYQGGQISLLDYVRVRALTYDAEAAGSRAEIGVAKARSRLNQAFGVIP
jgi:cobalt-zinc-cadmium efflux system outer membrane protein